MKNKVQLITYVDRIASNVDLKKLKRLVNEEFASLFGTIHILPFFDPIDGSDAGFDPIDHSKVDERLGDWSDIKSLSDDVDVMADLIVNHVSADSPQFLDYQKYGAQSKYAELFLSYGSVFPNGATEKELLSIYRPRPGLPFTVKTFDDGSTKLMWTTFTPNQMDINVENAAGRQYISGILSQFAEAGISSIRMDATGYAIKRPGTSCFMLPETYAFIDQFTHQAHDLGMEVLVEIHSYFRDQIEIAKKVDWVYDFALPPLILHAIYRKTSQYLRSWLEISPRNCLTVLDTHDGIGVIDVGPGADREGQPGILEPDEIDFLVEEMHRRTSGESKLATGAAASNLDLYQVNSTYFDALGKTESHYLLARAIQFFSPGIPQIYYVGLLGGTNDLDLLHQTGVGRDINRHYFTDQELASQLASPMVQKMFNLIRLRNSHPAFSGQLDISCENDSDLTLTWKTQNEWIKLSVDFLTLTYAITQSE